MAKRNNEYPATFVLPIRNNPVWKMDRSDEQFFCFNMTAWRARSEGNDGRIVGVIVSRVQGERVSHGELLGIALKNYFGGGICGKA